MTGYTLYVVLTIVVMFLASAIKILREYERGVVFLLGRFWKVKGPGFIIIIPVIQQMERVDLRTIVMDVPSQDVISRDNVSVHVNAVVYFRVIEPDKAIIQVENFFEATSQLAQTTLRSVLGQHELDRAQTALFLWRDDRFFSTPGYYAHIPEKSLRQGQKPFSIRVREFSSIHPISLWVGRPRQ